MADNATITSDVIAGAGITTEVVQGTSITSELTVGATGPIGPTGGVGPVGPVGPSGPPGTLSIYFDVTDYGAVGDGTANDTTAIQSAINAADFDGGGIVFFPQGQYKISSALVLYTGVSMLGCGSEASIITQTSTTLSGITAIDIASSNIEGLLIQGPSSGTGKGIDFAWSSAGNLPFLTFRDIWVRNFGSDGIALETPIVSRFDRVISQGNGGHGFNFYHAGTSVSFNSCWARSNAQSGYHFFESVYMSLNGCASDNNGINYLLESAQSIGMYACGSEGALTNGGSYNGFGFKIANSSVVNIDACWITDNRNLGVWITDGSQEVKINVADNTPNATAVNFIKTDVSTNSTIYELHNTTANSISAGTANIINDGALGAQFKDLYVKNSSGTLHMSAVSDASEYNISADTTGTLSLFGAGGQTLNMQLLDGYLQLTPLTATTVPYLDSNKRFVSSAVTPTELGYVSGVTSSIQTQLNSTLTNPMTAIGDIIQGTTAGAPSRLASVATGNVLLSGGVTTASSWGKVNLTAHVTGTLPVANGGTGITSLGAGVATFLGTPSSANLITAVTDETGTGALVFGTNPTLTGATMAGTLAMGTNSLTMNGMTISANSGSGTITFPGVSSSVTVVTTASTQTLTGKTITGLILTAGTTTVAPLTFSGVGALLTTAVANSVEWDGTNLYYTTSGPTRHTVLSADQTQTLTGKTYDTAGSGNAFKINGTSITAVTGTGAVVLASAPTITSLTVNTLTTLNTEMDLVGSSGTLHFTAATDGGDYNIFSSNGTQALAIYGSAGNVLNLNLFDGVLQTASTTRITNAGVLNNVTLDSAGTGNSLLVNGTALTAVTGTGAVVLATAPTIVTSLTLSAANIITDTTTGMKIGTATTQKLGFFNATPVVQQTAGTDLGSVLSTLGFRVGGSNYPILTSGAVTLTGAVAMNATTLATDTTTGLKIGTSATQKLGFFNATPVVQIGAYTVTGATPTRTLTTSGLTVAQLGNVVAQIIADIKSLGLSG